MLSERSEEVKGKSGGEGGGVHISGYQKSIFEIGEGGFEGFLHGEGGNFADDEKGAQGALDLLGDGV